MSYTPVAFFAKNKLVIEISQIYFYFLSETTKDPKK